MSNRKLVRLLVIIVVVALCIVFVGSMSRTGSTTDHKDEGVKVISVDTLRGFDSHRVDTTLIAVTIRYHVDENIPIIIMFSNAALNDWVVEHPGYTTGGKVAVRIKEEDGIYRTDVRYYYLSKK